MAHGLNRLPTVSDPTPDGPGGNFKPLESAATRIERFMGVESTRRPRSEAYLDGLRAFAVIAVVVVHCWALAGAPTLSILDRDFSFLLGTLGLGFDLFFILSAYLLAKPWFAANRAAMAPPGMRRFWLRRARRIVPAYFLSVILVLLVFVPAGRIPEAAITGRVGSWNLAGQTLFLQGYLPVSSGNLNNSNGSWWSLTVEASWYVILPLFVAAFVRYKWWITLPATLALSVAWLYLTEFSLGSLVDAMVRQVSGTVGLVLDVPPHEDTMRSLLRNMLPSYLFTFAIGVMLAKAAALRAARPGEARFWERRSCALIGLGTGLALLVLCQSIAYRYSSDPTSSATTAFLWRHIGIGFALGLILYAIIFGPAVLRRPLEMTALTFIGWVSYGIYLFHLPIGILLQTNSHLADLHGFKFLGALVALVTILATILAALSWMLIERAFLRQNVESFRIYRAKVSTRVVVAAILAVGAVASYGWVIGPASPERAAAVSHESAGVAPLFGDLAGARMWPNKSGAQTVAEAESTSAISKTVASVLAECGATAKAGSVYSLSGADWILSGSAFTCRHRDTAELALSDLVASRKYAGYTEVRVGGSIRFLTIAGPAERATSSVFIEYLSGPAVVDIALAVNPGSDADGLVERVLESAQVNYPATPK
jgi:peptidoglycan/LPS O-acetylase OafA/YrhL